METPLHVLIVEDDENDARLMLQVLREGGYAPSSLRVETAQALAVALETELWDIVLCDYTLPQYSGADALALVRARKPDLPVIFVTGTVGEEIVVHLIKAGACDYVLKDHLARLPIAVEQALREAAERRVHEETQRVLHNTARQLGGIMEAVMDAIFEIDTAGTILLANEAAHRLFGWPPGTLLNQPFSVIVPPEHREQYVAGLQQFLETGESAVIGRVTEVTGLRRDGTRVCCEISASSLTHNSGEQRLVGILRDITGRKRMEDDLKESNDMLAAVIDSAPVAIVSLDNGYHVTRWNHAAERMFGWTKDEVLGHPYRLVPEDRREEFRDITERMFRNEIVTGFETQCLHKDGHLWDVNLSVAPQRNAQGNISGLTGIILDVTEQHAMEQHAHRMEHLALLGQLLGGIAHEIKNPLFILTGSLQLLNERLTTKEYDKLQGDLDRMEKASKRMTQTIQQFLALARPVPPAQVPCAVQVILQQTLDFLGHELLTKQIRVEANLKPDLPSIKGDPRLLQEIFLNLIMNAVQAMSAVHGRGTLTLSATRVTDAESAVFPSPHVVAFEEEGHGNTEKGRRGKTEGTASPPSEGEGKGGGDWIEVRIQDDGPGIPPEHRTKLFEPFFTTKPAEQGTGLGLWTVRTIVMAMKGTVEVETEVGKGSTFIVSLPIEPRSDGGVDPGG
ncbi:MAG: PAS domain S-box protein [Nitrospirae bacterium]|nr:MAG: PAS domain S-box protein [Nitrospirota bacterium]